MSAQRDEVLALLRAQGPLQVNQIMAGCELIETGKELSNYLYNLRKAGEIARDDAGRYYLPAGGNTAPPPAASPETETPQPRKKAATVRRVSKPASPAAASPPAHVRAALDRSVEAAQAALDEYVYSVGDRALLDSLMAVRDAARKAREAWHD